MCNWIPQKNESEQKKSEEIIVENFPDVTKTINRDKRSFQKIQAQETLSKLH